AGAVLPFLLGAALGDDRCEQPRRVERVAHRADVGLRAVLALELGLASKRSAWVGGICVGAGEGGRDVGRRSAGGAELDRRVEIDRVRLRHGVYVDLEGA